jgi:hypothetical protein
MVVLSEGESGKMTGIEIGIETIDITETTIVIEVDLTGLTEMIPIEAVMIRGVVMMTEETMARIQDIGRTNNVGREDDGAHAARIKLKDCISTMMRVTLRFNTNLQATIDFSLMTKENDCSFPFQT